jgi:serine/threonine protein kinase
VFLPGTNNAPRLHGDIKLDNMLLKKGPSGSPYDFIAKIADFGHSHFRSVGMEEQDKRGLDRHGNQEYCMCPENWHIVQRDAPASPPG